MMHLPPTSIQGSTMCDSKNQPSSSSSSSSPKRSNGTAAAASPQGSSIFSKRDINSAYIFAELIGCSIGCAVHRVRSKFNGEEFACKSIYIGDGDSESYQEEIDIMCKLHERENVVKLKEVFWETKRICIVMDLCEGGDLLHGVIKMGQFFTEKKAAGLFRQIIKILSVCHDLDVVHGDVRPENLMFKNKGVDSPLVAIDFGRSTLCGTGRMISVVPGSLPYVAPEILKPKYEKEADIWSAGVTLCVLITGGPPFLKDHGDKAILDEVSLGNIDFDSDHWSTVSISAKDLVKKMLQKDPEARISTPRILEHPWVKEDGDASDKPMDVSIIRRMKRFREVTRYDGISLKVIAETLSEEEITSLKHRLMSADIDSSGTLTFEELKKALNEWGSSLEWRPKFSHLQVKQLLETDERINYDEFVAKLISYN